jgi:FkbM family methyltransferase
MAAAHLGSVLAGPGKLPRAIGLARSLVIYYGQPWRTRGLHRLYRQFLKPGDLAFDVGAHVGNRGRCWSHLGARVVAIEPQPDFAAWLRWQFQADPRVTVVQAALGAAAGTAEMHISRWHPTVTTFSKSWIGAVKQTGAFDKVAWDATVPVPLTTLDALIAAHGLPAFCKIDVEGYEAEVLRGLSRPVPALSLEYLPAALDVALAAIEHLARLGRYRFNVAQGEQLRLLWPEWRPAAALREWLEGERAGRRSGDIYARLAG